MYEIEKITKKDGSVHERQLRRKGHRVFIADVALDHPLEAVYVDDEDKVLRTSPIEAYNSEWRTKGHLIVQTRNSIYVFNKLKEEQK